MLMPEAARRLAVGARLAARPAIQAAWFKLLSTDASAIIAVLLQRMLAAGVPEDMPTRATVQVQWPNWPKYKEGPTESIRTFTSSFKLVAEAAKVPADQWGAIYILLLHGYAATIAISYQIDEVPDATFTQLSNHLMDTMERQHIQADKTALETQVLGPNEDIGDFANALRVLTRRAYGHMYKPPQVEERAGEAFGRGLTGLIKQRVREEFPESLYKVISLAKNLEAVGVSRIDKVVAPVAPAVAGPRPAVGAAWAPRNPGGRGTSHGSQGSQGTRSSTGLSQGSGAWPKADLICWFCHFKGHTKAECRKKVAAAAAAKNGPSKNGREPGNYRPPESQ
jgi:hypothetical protein